ncbi:MAG: HAD-IB family hydrolase [Deltaproteobacteria bacterium]|nr:HAD-IB family hydrolase [Deltaproteobacteria bacterium]
MSKQAAVFYDVDGTLVAGTVVHPCLWYAAHQALPSRSLLKSVGLLSRVPWYWALDQVSRPMFNRLFYREYRGMTRNRLLTLAEEMFVAMIRSRIYPGVADLVARSKAQGLVQVFVTGALDFTVDPLARHLGIEHVIANRLEFEGGVATGRLLSPVIAAESKVDCIRSFAKRHGIDLADSYAYADSFSDLPMLTVVGKPAAVEPDRRLKATAHARRWPVIEWRGHA